MLTRGNKPIAELRPVPSGRHLGELPGLMASLPRLSAAEAGEFAADLDATRDELAGVEVHDQWES